MGAAEHAADFIEIAKGFGASAPIIIVLWVLLSKSEKRNEQLQKENIEMLKDTVALGVSLKSLLERVVTKIGA